MILLKVFSNTESSNYNELDNGAQILAIIIYNR